MMTCYRLHALLAAGLLFAVAACDSSDPIDPPDPSEVAGVYHFAELYFRPDASGVAPADVLARLDSAASVLRLSSNGGFLLLYEFEDGDLYNAFGDFELTSRTVRLNGDGNRADYERILLDNSLTLQRSESDPDVLTAEIRKSADLRAFDPVTYANLAPVPGTLYITLVTD